MFKRSEKQAKLSLFLKFLLIFHEFTLKAVASNLLNIER